MAFALIRTVTAFALFCCVSICACATSGSPATYGGTSIAAFADSRHYDPEVHVDPALLTSTVKILPWKRTLNELFVERAGPQAHSSLEAGSLNTAFDEWCQANGGQPGLSDDATAAFRTAAEEYWHQRLEAQKKEINRDMSPRACVGADGAIVAGYLNLANADIAFFDRAAAARFIDKFRGPAKERAGRESAAALAESQRNEEERRSAAEKRRQRDPHPDLEPRRRAAVLEVAQLVKEYGIFEHLEYVDSCVIRGGKVDKAASEVFLGAIDRQMAENLSWIEVPTVGIVFHPYITEGFGKDGIKLAIKDKEVATRIVRQLEEIGDSCH